MIDSRALTSAVELFRCYLCRPVHARNPILELVASLDYAVSVHRVNGGVVEMHAVKLADAS